MNRRTFLARTFGVVAAAVAAPLVGKPAIDWGSTPDFTVVTWRGAPIYCDPHGMSNRIYFVNTRDWALREAWDSHELHFELHRKFLHSNA